MGNPLPVHRHQLNMPARIIRHQLNMPARIIRHQLNMPARIINAAKGVDAAKASKVTDHQLYRYPCAYIWSKPVSEEHRVLGQGRGCGCGRVRLSVTFRARVRSRLRVRVRVTVGGRRRVKIGSRGRAVLTKTHLPLAIHSPNAANAASLLLVMVTLRHHQYDRVLQL